MCGTVKRSNRFINLDINIKPYQRIKRIIVSIPANSGRVSTILGPSDVTLAAAPMMTSRRGGADIRGRPVVGQRESGDSARPAATARQSPGRSELINMRSLVLLAALALAAASPQQVRLGDSAGCTPSGMLRFYRTHASTHIAQRTYAYARS